MVQLWRRLHVKQWKLCTFWTSKPLNMALYRRRIAIYTWWILIRKSVSQGVERTFPTISPLPTNTRYTTYTPNPTFTPYPTCTPVPTPRTKTIYKVTMCDEELTKSFKMEYDDIRTISSRLQSYVAGLPYVKSVSYSFRTSVYNNRDLMLHGVIYTSKDDGKRYLK